MAGVANTDLYQRLTVRNTQERDAFQPRRWGMVITVQEGSTQTDYELVYGALSTDINDNDNWLQVENANVFGSETRYFTRVLEPHNAATTVQSSILSSDEINDGESVLIEIPWTAKDDNGNTGAGGLFLCAWTKAGGSLNKIFDNDSLKGSDTGETFTISSLDSFGNIRVQAAVNINNFSISWVARITKRTP